MWWQGISDSLKDPIVRLSVKSRRWERERKARHLLSLWSFALALLWLFANSLPDFTFTRSLPGELAPISIVIMKGKSSWKGADWTLIYYRTSSNLIHLIRRWWLDYLSSMWVPGRYTLSDSTPNKNSLKNCWGSSSR